MGNMWINCNDNAMQTYTCTMNIHLHHCTKVIKPCMFYHLPCMVPEKNLRQRFCKTRWDLACFLTCRHFFNSKYIIARTFSFCTRINFYSIMRILLWNSATAVLWSGFRITGRIHKWAVARLYGMLLGVWRRGIRAHHCEYSLIVSRTLHINHSLHKPYKIQPKR